MYPIFRKRRKHNSLRYAGRDYSRPGKFFVTICTGQMEKWFGKVINGEMQLSEIGQIAEKCWCEIPQHFSNVVFDEYVVMPNHVHGIIVISKSDVKPMVGSLHATTLPVTMSSISPKTGSLSVVIRSYKSAVTKHSHKFDTGFAWQRGFYDNIICTTGQLSRIRKYIINNPENWNM